MSSAIFFPMQVTRNDHPRLTFGRKINNIISFLIHSKSLWKMSPVNKYLLFGVGRRKSIRGLGSQNIGLSCRVGEAIVLSII